MWNLLQSHPEVCAPRHETGAIFRNTEHLAFSRYIRFAKKTGLIHTAFSHRLIDYMLYRYKLETLERRDNIEKYQDVPYTKEEVKSSAICLKSVDDHIDETELLNKIYPGMYTVFLVRNGYAVTESHLRRGKSVEETAKLYKRVGEKMKILSSQLERSIFVSFEDILQDPFSVAEKLYRFAELQPDRLDKLKLKSKTVVKEEGKPQAAYGEAETKYWFDRKTIGDIIDPNVNQRQVSTLTPEQVREFNSIASETLDLFSYEIKHPEAFATQN